MCGIFGLIARPGTSLKATELIEHLGALFSLSEARGSEASGLALSHGGAVEMFRRATPAKRMLASPEYQTFVSRGLTDAALAEGLAAIGHSRLVTNGTQGMEQNNQPVLTRHLAGVHNGIVVNDAELWAAHPELKRESELDSEILFKLVDANHQASGSLELALRQTYEQIEGEANIAFLHASQRVLALATNVGSLYYTRLDRQGVFYFASERHFLEAFLAKAAHFRGLPRPEISQLRPVQGLLVGISDLAGDVFDIQAASGEHEVSRPGILRPVRDASPGRPALRRCTRCILPHTFPFISFDQNGVCNFCRETPVPKADSRKTLEELVAKYRRNDGTPDCIVALSGGRDSCYGLHVVKRELGLNPVAYTYDWAMVTDEARRNSSRVCAELGVEHIIRSANILVKRRNIRLNIEAWLKRPELGMIPLFMAGDKQFFHYATQVSRQTRIPLVIFCGGNNLEVTRFKTGFCGVQDQSTNTMVSLDLEGKLKLLAYYARNYLLNPRYINRSVLDTLFAFYSTYVNRQDFIYLYRYVDWDEKVIGDTLSRHYGWESSGDSASTWRIGDGTAAFYNYIYHTVAGFSEHDTFRSNQIRAGLLTREQALALVEEENKPRYAAMREYAQLVGFSLDEALTVINAIPKLQ